MTEATSVVLQKVHTVDMDLGEGKLYQAGWGYLEFTDHAAAVAGLARQIPLPCNQSVILD